MQEYCYIELTQGQVAQVSPKHFDYFCRDKWYAHWDQKTKTFYAERKPRISDGWKAGMPRKSIKMHSVVLEIEGHTLEGLIPDHIFGDTLDNRIEMLRPATVHQNARNRKLASNNKSGFKGVIYTPNVKSLNKWRASIKVNNKIIFLGNFSTPEEANEAYLAASLLYHGEFARAA